MQDIAITLGSSSSFNQLRLEAFARAKVHEEYVLTVTLTRNPTSCLVLSTTRRWLLAVGHIQVLYRKFKM